MSVRSRILGPPVPKMPSGLIELMDGLARDVLKNNPQNIYEFCVHHMETLLTIRDGCAPKPTLTLDQKIAKAQQKVKERAEERQRDYDKKIVEDTNNLQVLPAADIPCCNQDSQSDEKEVEKAAVVVHSEEKQDIIEEKVLEKPARLLSCDLNENEAGLNELNHGNIVNELNHGNIVENINIKNKINQESITTVDSGNNEKSNLLKEDEQETDDSTKKNGTSDLIENNVSENVQLIITNNSTKAENDELIDEEISKSPNINIIEENNISLEDFIHLHYEDTESIQNDSGNEVQNEIEINVKDMSDEHNTTETMNKTDLISQDILEGDSHFYTHIQLLENTDTPPTKKILNEKFSESNLNIETTSNVAKEHAEVLNELEKSQDDKIPTVIISPNSTESVSLQNNEPDVVVQPYELKSVQVTESESLPIELEQKIGQISDTASVPQSAHDTTFNNINSSMDLETAAITIQKVFRSFLFKTKTASYDDPTTVDIALLTDDKEKEENEAINNKDRRHLGINRMDTVLQTVNEEKSLSLSTDDSSTLSSAATIIQAHVRGFLVRNKLNLNKTISSNSMIDSDAPSIPSLEADSDNIKSKTVLNIHIIPDGGHFISRDESVLTSMDLSLDSSPPCSVNLHPLGYDKSERRKQLKREDAVQSVSPPSNNSGKLSEDHDSLKEILTVNNNAKTEQVNLGDKISMEVNDILEKDETKVITKSDTNIKNSITDAASDEMDVITPFEDRTSRESDTSTKLLHSSEFHDIVVPTNVTRSDTSVVRGE